MEKFWFFNGIRFYFKDQKGAVLVFSILVLVMVSLWGAATLTLSTNEYHINNSSKKAIQAYYLAEAGLEEGISILKADPENFEAFSGTLDTGSYYVSKSGKVPGTVILTSIGTVADGTKKTLTAELKIIRTGGSTNDIVIGSYGNRSLNVSRSTINGDLLYNGSISVSGSAEINGNVFCNGYFLSQGGTYIMENVYSKGGLDLTSTNVDGFVYTDGEVNHNWTSYINGRQLKNPPNPKYSAENNGGFAIYPFISFEVTKFPEQFKGEWYLPSWGEGYLLSPQNGFIDSLPDLPEGKSYYIVPGNTTLTGTIHKPGAIIVSNDTIKFDNRYGSNATQPDFNGLTIVGKKIEMNAYNSINNCTIHGKTIIDFGGNIHTTIDGNNNVLLISNGNISIPSGFNFQGGIISEANISVGGSTNITGSIHGKEVTFEGSTTFTYDNATLQSISWPFISQHYKVTLIKWNEISE